MEIITLTVISKHTCACKLVFIKQRKILDKSLCCFIKERNQYVSSKKQTDTFLEFFESILPDTNGFQFLKTVACLF